MAVTLSKGVISDKPHDGWMRLATQKDKIPEVLVLGDQHALLLVGQRQQRLV